MSKFFSFFAVVVDTANKHSFANIREFSKKFEMVLMGYSGAQGTLIYEKNLMSKISCQTPFQFVHVSFKNRIKLKDLSSPSCFQKLSFKEKIVIYS
jgi:hypothetical protein